LKGSVSDNFPQNWYIFVASIMASVQLYKRIDLWAQVVAIILPWVIFFIVPKEGRVFHLEHIVASYFIVGICQVASAIINRFRLPDEYKAKGRKRYVQALVGIIVFTFAGYMLNILIFVFMVLLYASPAMALWYLIITALELKKLTAPVSDIIDTGIKETHLQ